MKVLAAALLLLLGTGCLEGAVVRREAEPPGPPGPPGAEADLERRVEAAFEALEGHLQTFSDYITKELPSKLEAEKMKQQAKEYLERAGQHFAPLATELRTNVLELFAQLLHVGKQAVTQP
ncbi:apolipoprotein A-II-like [Dromaius novaehollandiae]|uniref:apolipoprotein A-II-like n=1 Tax=Dromaius novaehollandiae TaxID=8790 RepID=UPI00311F3A76